MSNGDFNGIVAISVVLAIFALVMFLLIKKWKRDDKAKKDDNWLRDLFCGGCTIMLLAGEAADPDDLEGKSKQRKSMLNLISLMAGNKPSPPPPEDPADWWKDGKKPDGDDDSPGGRFRKNYRCN